MNKTQFLMTLYDALEGLPGNIKADIMSEYQDIFRTGMEQGQTEEEIAASLGDPITLAYAIRQRYQTSQHRPQRVSFVRLCLTGIALIFFNLVFVLGPSLGALGVLIGLWCTSLGLSISGIALLGGTFLSFLTAFNIMAQSHLSFLTVISASVFVSSLGLLLGMGCLFLTRWSIKILGRYIRWNFKTLLGR